MAVGRKTGGRQKGTPNKLTSERIAEIAEGGILPLDYMLSVLRDDGADRARRDEMAKAAAPYVHPRLAAVEHAGKDGGALVVEVVRFAQDQITQSVGAEEASAETVVLLGNGRAPGH